MVWRISEYYDDNYFTFQLPMGEFGGWENVTKFGPFIRKDMGLLDFGCGGGPLLKKWFAAEKLALKLILQQQTMQE
jgi:2-polyprenyl-3-methyl-5-hydroxy-6-metoxy-1,4-benzoquinol methylase